MKAYLPPHEHQGRTEEEEQLQVCNVQLLLLADRTSETSCCAAGDQAKAEQHAARVALPPAEHTRASGTGSKAHNVAVRLLTGLS